MVAATGPSGDPLDAGRQVAIAIRDHAGQSIDLAGGFRRRLDLDPAADALEDSRGIKGIGGRQHDLLHSRANIDKPRHASLKASVFGSKRNSPAGRSVSMRAQAFSAASRAAICSTSSTM